jgi:flavin-binding protein dodecin
VAFTGSWTWSASARHRGRDAGRRAVETAATSLRDLRIAEVTKMDMTVENGKVVSYRTRVALSFKYEA